MGQNDPTDRLVGWALKILFSKRVKRSGGVLDRLRVIQKLLKLPYVVPKLYTVLNTKLLDRKKLFLTFDHLKQNRTKS